MKRIAVTGMEAEERAAGFSYYLNELYESDRFIGELIRALENFEEKTLVVFYGDHLPSFDIQEEELSLGDSQTTEYVLWANYPLTFAERNLQSYQLGAYVLQRAGIYEGAMFRLHQFYDYSLRGGEEYQEELQILEYDMLYGDGYFEQEGLPEPKPLRYDVEDVTVRAIAAPGVWLLLGGGIAYTVGAVLYGIGKKHRYVHSIFHLFVVLGSLLQFLCILLYVI